jgi:hypothetical protein
MVQQLLSVDPASLKIDTERVAFQLDSFPPYLRGILLEVEERLERELVARAKAKADNDVLQVRSGRFEASIEGVVNATSSGVYARVFSTDPKAGILEYGGDIPAHEIDPNTARALHFLGRGGETFASHVEWPGAHIAPHPTIHAAFSEMEEQIYQELLTTIIENVGIGPSLDPEDMLPGEMTILRAVGTFVK